MTNIIRQNQIQFIYIALLSLVYVYCLNNAFFWDTVQLGSKHALHYFSNDFSSLFLPENLDSGHIPAFGFYLALGWKIFGRTLFVSHLLMLPFITGIVWQLILLIKRVIPVSYRGITLLLVGLDPTLVSQITLVSPDIVLLFFFLLGLNSIISNHKIFLSIAIFGLFLSSMRGMMTTVCLLIVDVSLNVCFRVKLFRTIRLLIVRSLIYLPALLLFLVYSIAHYHNTGWIGFHSNSPWAESFHSVGWGGVLYNVGILLWRLIDFGRIGIWLIIGFLLIRYWNRVRADKEILKIISIALCFLLILPLNMLWAKGLMAHRYLLPIFLLIALGGAKLLYTLPMSQNFRSGFTVFWIGVLVTGNLWIYPPKVSQGWDSSLAHLPYFSMRLEALSYIDENNIPFDQVESFFPNLATLDEIDLSNDLRSFNSFEGKSKYVFYSNVYNIDDDAYEILNSDYAVVKEFKKLGVYIRILQKNNIN